MCTLQFSDGGNTVEESLARQAKQFGCDVLAITDHADRKRRKPRLTCANTTKPFKSLGA